MKPNQHRPVAPDISDESATIIVAFLRELARQYEALYALQIKRHRAAQRRRYVPDQPWQYPHEPF